LFLVALGLETKSATISSNCHLAFWPQQAAGRLPQHGARLRGAAPTDLPLLVAPRSIFPADVSRGASGEKPGLLPAERPALDAAPATQHHVDEHAL